MINQFKRSYLTLKNSFPEGGEALLGADTETVKVPHSVVIDGVTYVPDINNEGEK